MQKSKGSKLLFGTMLGGGWVVAMSMFIQSQLKLGSFAEVKMERGRNTGGLGSLNFLKDAAVR